MVMLALLCGLSHVLLGDEFSYPNLIYKQKTASVAAGAHLSLESGRSLRESVDSGHIIVRAADEHQHVVDNVAEHNQLGGVA